MVQSKLRLYVDRLEEPEVEKALNLVKQVYELEKEVLEEGGAERNYAHSLLEIWVSSHKTNAYSVLKSCFSTVKSGSPNTYTCTNPQKAVIYFSYWFKGEGFVKSKVRITLEEYFTNNQFQFSKSMELDE